jgi:hypothetical protein
MLVQLGAVKYTHECYKRAINGMDVAVLKYLDEKGYSKDWTWSYAAKEISQCYYLDCLKHLAKHHPPTPTELAIVMELNRSERNYSCYCQAKIDKFYADLWTKITKTAEEPPKKVRKIV